jgi:hypothetical protein
MLIDVAIPGDRNVIDDVKEAEKFLKYKDLTVYIQRMWNVKTQVMPVIIGATGTISKCFRRHFEQHTRKARYQGTTESSYIGHSTHTLESANVEAQKSLILKTALYAPLTVHPELLQHCVP